MKVGKIRINRKRLDWLLRQPLQVKLEMLKHHLEIVRLLVNEILEEEVRGLCGERYSRAKPEDGRYARWGFNPGSVKVGSERIRIAVPRVHDRQSNSKRSLESYEQLRCLEAFDDSLMRAVLLGLSMRDYRAVVSHLLDSFGMSRSKVSQEFIERSMQKLEEFENRRLEGHDFVALFIDGKQLAKEQIIIVLGVTLSGEKIPLSFIESHTENAQSIKALLRNLIDRGLKYQHGLLCIVDGSKGIVKAVEEVFGFCAVIQRCQWHKRENIVSYLNKTDQAYYRKKLNRAYRCEDYQQAKQQLLAIRDELRLKNLSAARSLEEGLEQTLTLHRLGLNEALGRSFSTTNCIENLNSLIENFLGKVKHWQNSEQRFRWIACALLESEKRMRRVNNFDQLHKLREKIEQEINQSTQGASTA